MLRRPRDWMFLFLWIHHTIRGLYDFRHVYKEQNMSADRLSKEALNMKAGLLSFSELLEGEIIEEGMIQLF